MKRFYLFLMEQHPTMMKFIAGDFVIAGIFLLLNWIIAPAHIIFNVIGTGIAFCFLMLVIVVIMRAHGDFRNSQDPRFKSRKVFKQFLVFYYREWPKMSVFFLMAIGVFLLSIFMDCVMKEPSARILWCLAGIGIVFFSIRSIDTIVAFQKEQKSGTTNA